MPRSACVSRTWRCEASLPVTRKGGALCRPTIASSGQQPGRERPRRPRSNLFPALFGGRSRSGCSERDGRPIRRHRTASCTRHARCHDRRHETCLAPAMRAFRRACATSAASSVAHRVPNRRRSAMRARCSAAYKRALAALGGCAALDAACAPCTIRLSRDGGHYDERDRRRPEAGGTTKEEEWPSGDDAEDRAEAVADVLTTCGST
jgi:hypothetical protein